MEATAGIEPACTDCNPLRNQTKRLILNGNAAGAPLDQHGCLKVQVGYGHRQDDRVAKHTSKNAGHPATKSSGGGSPHPGAPPPFASGSLP